MTHKLALLRHGQGVWNLENLFTGRAAGRAGARRRRQRAAFSLHAGIAARAHQRDKLERLCRYVPDLPWRASGCR